MKIFALAVVALAAMIAQDTTEHPLPIQVVMYLQTQTVLQGEKSSIVLEIANGTKSNLLVSNRIRAYRQVDRTGDLPHREDIQRRTLGKSAGEWFLQVRVIAQPGSEERGPKFIPATVEDSYTVDAGKSFLVKVTLPGDYLPKGTCVLDAALFRGPTELARSEVRVIQCIPAPANADAQ